MVTVAGGTDETLTSGLGLEQGCFGGFTGSYKGLCFRIWKSSCAKPPQNMENGPVIAFSGVCAGFHSSPSHRFYFLCREIPSLSVAFHCCPLCVAKLLHLWVKGDPQPVGVQPFSNLFPPPPPTHSCLHPSETTQCGY